MEAVTSSRIEGIKARFEDLFSTIASSNMANILEVKDCAKAFRQGERILSEARSIVCNFLNLLR